MFCFNQSPSGPVINDTIRGSFNNDNTNNTDSLSLLAAWAKGAIGEQGAQFLETDWENITFQELFLLLSPFTLHSLYVLPLTKHAHTYNVGFYIERLEDSPACVWVWWVVYSGRSFCGKGRRRYTSNVQCCPVSTGAWRWLHSLHIHVPLTRNMHPYISQFINKPSRNSVMINGRTFCNYKFLQLYFCSSSNGLVC